VKIIDFGFAVITEGSKMSVFCGTPNYMAPELLLKIVLYSYEVDLWAMGIILYYLYTGHYPFKGKNEQELYTSIKAGLYLRPSNISELGYNFLDRLLASNPRKRITASETLSHKWLSEPMIRYLD
jgi:MAP/microtubule affinity-regulating kinase